jgi:hypothetical protein
MALPKKKSRPIEVEGRRYRWSANQRGVVGDLAVACQDESAQGAVLVVRIQHTDPWYRISMDGRADTEALPPNELLAVTPSFVRSAIEFGLSVGWNPLSEGGQVVLRYQDGSFRIE